tara:strand:+ start:199 stop:408 length:210 start_codon:yes stop_codon:yes gene_type:complete
MNNKKRNWLVNPNKLAMNNKREIKEAILTMDKLYWAIEEREENMKDEHFIELIQYTKQMYDEFKEIIGD